MGYHNEQKFSYDDIKNNMDDIKEDNVGNNDQQLNDDNADNVKSGDVKKISVSQKKKVIAKEKWYWFCDEGGIKWIPYKDEHQSVIENAWNDQTKMHVIVMERFKIDFNRSANADAVPSGTQYNYQIHDSWRRGVIRGIPDKGGLLNGILCDKNPRLCQLRLSVFKFLIKSTFYNATSSFII